MLWYSSKVSSGIFNMSSRRLWLAILAIAAGTILTIVVILTSSEVSGWRFGTLLAAAGCGAASVFFIWPRRKDEGAEVTSMRARLARSQAKIDEQAEAFETARTALLADLDSKTQRLDERERDLVSRFARFHEFLEYPIEDVHAERLSGELQKLTEQDKEVRQLLEKEAERVYEKIRNNGYTTDGRVDAIAIRDEGLQLITRVAKIYKPESEFPLLETSFEQLARAASRICLHTLVLLEQLPVNVQHYSINTLYGYIRKAVVGYGVYQKATPWITYLSRGIYAGRMVATANPAALGAWWLATELGKQGARKFVENVVDRQAVAVLHDLITIVGIEAAGIYGTGFRQRDPAWILGTELVELIHAFPQSGESLKSGLQKITALPLRSEYDRIYLYRCLADHRSAGLHLADPAMLSRDEREAIARPLEHFFLSSIHGASDSSVKKWREGFERRFDLRLNLSAVDQPGTTPGIHQIEEALRSLISFLRHVVTADNEAILFNAKSFLTLGLLEDSQRNAALKEVSSSAVGTSFEPPALDPASEVTKLFLQDLAGCATVAEQPERHVEQVVVETWSYFRHTAKEAHLAIGNAWKQKLRWQCVELSLADEIPAPAARAFFACRRPGEKILFAYGGLSRRQDNAAHVLPDHWLFGTENPAAGERRVIVVGPVDSDEVVWSADMPISIERVSGILIDSAAITNGHWHQIEGIAEFSSGDLLIAGSLLGGRYRSHFRQLLDFCTRKSSG